MSLSESWLKFSKKFIDNMMLELQQDSGVSFAEWQSLQKDYKELYGKDYERSSIQKETSE